MKEQTKNLRASGLIVAALAACVVCGDAAAASFTQYSEGFVTSGLSANPASPTEISTTLPTSPGPLPGPPIEISDIQIFVDAMSGQFSNVYIEIASDPGTIYQLPDNDPFSGSSAHIIFYNPEFLSPANYAPGFTLYEIPSPLLSELDDGTLDVSIYVDGTPGGAEIDYRFLAYAWVRPAEVPEPGALALLGGLAFFTVGRRRRA